MSDQKPIGVGVIGYEKGRSWGAVAHVPALRTLPEYAVAAVATSRRETALVAAADIGLPSERAFSSAAELVTCPDVDVVAITVKVPHHLDLVRLAAASGKDVYCEWPLGNGLAEAEEMAQLVERAKVRGVIGLQARCSPAIAYVRDIVSSGELGDLLSSSMLGSGTQWGNRVDRANAYILDSRTGASLLTIPFGHAVDAMCYCLGEFDSLSATTAIRISDVRQIEDDQILRKTVPDQIGISGALKNGAVATVHYRGGSSRGANFAWEINGTKGDLRIEATSGHAQMSELRLSGGFGRDKTVAQMTIPDKYRWAPESCGIGFNVAQVYRRLSEDRRTGASLSAGFDVAVVRHRMLAAIEKAAAIGQRVAL